MDNADLIAALDLVVNTGHTTTDEHGNPHWAISERQRDIARDALVAARAPYSAPAKGTAAIRWLTGTGWAIIDATCSECDHTMQLGHSLWTALVCQGCQAELTQAGGQ